MTSPSVGAGIPVATATGIVGSGGSGGGTFNGVPKNSTPVFQQNTAAAGVTTCNLPATTGKTYYITGFEISNDGATTPTSVIASIGSFIGSGNYFIPVGALAVGVPTLISVEFTAPLIGLLGQAVALTIPSLGPGNAHSIATLHGYLL